MEQIVYVKNYGAPPFHTEEMLRYAGVREPLPEMRSLLTECLGEVQDKFVYRVCYAEVPISREDKLIRFDFIEAASKDLEKHLENCDTAVLFAATVGIAIDRLIAKYGVRSPSKALMLQAIGAERIESLCDVFETEITERERKRGRETCFRFSPGYGDLPIALQRDIFGMLDCPRKIGLTLNDSHLMSPSKSVTAIIGIKNSQE